LYHFWLVGSDCRRNHPSQIFSRLIQATGTQNVGFPIDFDSRPYNSVMHYHATLWYKKITMHTQWHPLANTNIMFEIGISFTCLGSFILFHISGILLPFLYTCKLNTAMNTNSAVLLKYSVQKRIYCAKS